MDGDKPSWVGPSAGKFRSAFSIGSAGPETSISRPRVLNFSTEAWVAMSSFLEHALGHEGYSPVSNSNTASTTRSARNADM